MDGKDILLRDFYRRRSDAIFKCFAAAARRGYRAFAVQHQGWCATGPRAHLTYRKYGRYNRCRNGKGGPWANDVYFIRGEFKELVVIMYTGFVRVLENLESPGILLWHFPGLESRGQRLSGPGKSWKFVKLG